MRQTVKVRTRKEEDVAQPLADNLYQLYRQWPVAAIDAGNGFTELATPQTMLSPMARERYDLRSVWAPVTSRNASVADRGEGMLIGSVNGGSLYAFGMTARTVAPRSTVTHARGIERYTSLEYRQLVLCVLARYLAEHFDTTDTLQPVLIHGLPGSVWGTKGLVQSIRQGLVGEWAVALEAPLQTTVRFVIGDDPAMLMTLPEPLGAFNDMCFDEDGVPDAAMIAHDVFMWDVGSQTTDYAVIRRGKPDIDSIGNINLGVHLVAERALEAYHSANGSGRSIEEIDMCLESGEVHDPRTNKMIPFGEPRDEALREITRAMLNAMAMLRDRQVSYDMVVVGGGGGPMLLNATRDGSDLKEETENWIPARNPRRGVVEGMLKTALKALRSRDRRAGQPS